MLTQTQSEFVDASVDGDVDSLELLVAKMTDQEVFELTASVFISAMWRQFPDDLTSDEISRVARESMDQLPGIGLRQVVLEAVLRSVFGDVSALDSLTASEAHSARMALSRLYFFRNPLNPADRSTLHAEVAEAMTD